LVREKKEFLHEHGFTFRFLKVEKEYEFDPEPSPTRFGKGEEGLADLATHIRRGRGIPRFSLNHRAPLSQNPSWPPP
jgi:hypothetical protein